ncbi:MAG: VanW family protein [Eubacterium sp.]|nr:VanW family protein [Eubacterium sp.]
MRKISTLKCKIAATLALTMIFALTPNAVMAEKASTTDGSSSSVEQENKEDANGENAVIRDNIFINGQEVGGLSREEAEKLIGASAGDATPVTLTSDYGDIDTTLGDLGLTDNTEEILDEAFKYGNTGSVLKRYKDIENLKTKPVEYKLERTVREASLSKVVDRNIGQAMRGENSYSLNHNDDGSVNIVVEGASVSLDASKTREAIEKEINVQGYDGDPVNVKIPFINNQDKETKKQLERVTSLLGEYITDYSSSGPSRATNVERAAYLCNGRVVFPGEQFSIYSCISPVDESNGYESAHIFVGTEVVDGLGGGVCQVASTLYNAALRAELDITQRECHSMLVSYVPISADAAVAGGILDLKFINNLDAPIYIESGYDGYNLRFSIYGEEYRPSNRTIEFESVQTGVIYPPEEPILTEDKSLKPGTQEVTSGAVTGYTGELWKYVYVDGVLTDSILINTSYYEPSAARVSINTDPPTEEDKQADPNNPNPADPNAPQDPNNPAKPTDPNAPQDPNNPTTPVDPNAPQDPTTPVDPNAPQDSTTPVDPNAPQDPAAPANPE